MFNYTYNNLDFAHKLGTAGEPKDDFDKHLHSFNEVLFFVKGHVSYNVESESKMLSEGDLVLIRPGKYHFAEVKEQAEYDRYVLKFPDSVLPPHLAERLKTQKTFFGNVKKYSLTFNQLDSYVGNFNEQDTYSLFVAELTKLLILLCKEQNVAATHSDEFIAKLVDYIDAPVKEPNQFFDYKL